jgi:hypothetical protein
MRELTVKDYMKAIRGLIQDEEKIKVLKKLYHSQNSTASAIDLAKKLKYSHFICANNQIGKIGKAIAMSKKELDIESIPYYIIKGIKHPCYFFLVGTYHEPLREAGWKMRKNLKIALKNWGL